MKYSIDHISPVPLHAQVEALLRKMIDDPGYRSGKFLPNEVDLAKKLNFRKGDPVLKRKRFVFDPGGHPIEYNLGYYKSDSFVYTIESERDIP
ncbi:MAG: UTRA domain-containing protein [Bacteroidales bacterium]|nr:UTRA domain-containing protein [Bacteroidales bacterium]